MKYTVIRSVIPVAAAICLTACGSIADIGRRSNVAEPDLDAVEDAAEGEAASEAEGQDAAESNGAAGVEDATVDGSVVDSGADSETGESDVDSVAASETEDAPEAEAAPEQDTATEPALPDPVGHKYEYSKDTSSIVKKLMKCDLKASDTSDLQSLLDDMKAADPAMGKLWDGIMNYWIFTENSQEINYDNLPDALPDDDSLCIVIAGYELERDGKMRQELVDRMETGLACAKKYPKAFILVTGGPTAHDKNNTTEAGAMAAWLVEHGVDEKRLLVEEKSLSTAHNATYGNALIREKAPQVHSLAVVTSDYHVGLVSLLFYAETQRYAYETGTVPFDIVANAASRVDDPGEKISHGLAASLLSNVMEP